MKYAVVKCVNGNYFIDSEGFTSLDKAIVKFHSVCEALWNATDVEKACVMIIDEKLETYPQYHELIKYTA
jgi:hypothetical protein